MEGLGICQGERCCWVLKNWCFRTVVLEKTLESSLDCKEIQSVHPKGNQSWIFRKDWCWSWNSNTLATWCEQLTHVKRPWCWERLKVGGERYDRGWDGCMASLTQWTWVWVSSRSWRWTRRPGMLQSMGSQRVGHDWATELSWTEGERSLVHRPLGKREIWSMLRPIWLQLLLRSLTATWVLLC